MDAGGGLEWSDPDRGLSSAEVSARGLVSHEAAGLRDEGAQATVNWEGDPSSERGLSLALRGSVGGVATGGAQALLGRATMAELSGDAAGGTRAEAELGYGLAAFGGGFTGTLNLKAG